MIAGLLVLLCACGEDREAEAVEPPPTIPSSPPPLERTQPFQPLSDEALLAQIEAAKVRARSAGKRVLLEFQADWCTDCREVVRLSGEGPAREVLEQNYEVVYVDVGRFDRHRALIAEHSVERIVTLVVLDPESGERVARTTLEPITGLQRGLTSAQLATWLRNPS